MRMALAVVALLLAAPLARAQPSSRAQSVVDELGVDDKIAQKLVEILSRYDQDVDRLHQQRVELKRRLVAAKRVKSKELERVLDDAITNQRALVDVDARLITRLRSFLSPRLTAQVLVLLSVTEPTATVAQMMPRHDPDALWPPGTCDPFSSQHTCARQCDPFESMHGCSRF